MSRVDYASPRTAPSSPHRRVPQGLIIGICVLILSCAGAILYAGQGAAEVAYRLIVEGSIVLLWLASAAGWGVWLTSYFLRFADDRVAWTSTLARANVEPPVMPTTGKSTYPRHPDQTIRVVTSIAVGLGLMALAILGLGLFGVLSRVVGFVLLSLGVLSGILWVLRFRRSSTRFSGHHRQASTLAHATRSTWLWLAVVPAASLALVAAFVPPGLLWKPHEPHGYDVVEYHFQVPREWYDAGRIQPTPHNAFGYFPFGVEMHDLLAFHLSGGAWNGMYLAQLMHVAMMALAVFAACGFANQIARSARAAVIANVLGATVPLLAQLAPIGFNEGGLLLYGILAIGWTLQAVMRTTAAEQAPCEEPHQSRRIFALAGLCAGFACGVKLTAVPLLLVAVPVVAVCVACAFRANRVVPFRSAMRSAVVGATVFVAVAVVVFSHWLVRNIVWTGNPVFPEGRALFGNGAFSDVQAARWTAAHSAQPEQRSIGGRLAAFVDQVCVNPQFGYLLLPMAVVALVLNRRHAISWYLGGLLLIQLVFWLGFTHLQGRFFVLAVLVAMLAIASAPWHARSSASAIALVVVVLVVAIYSWSGIHRPFAAKLYEEQGTGIAVALGKEDISWITAGSLEGFPLHDPAARLVLVGDAQAFWYPLTSSRLYYRTVFDLDTSSGRSLLDAFDPTGWRRDGKTWLLMVPAELDRYEKTYQPFPPIPDAWRRSPLWQRGLPFLIPPNEVSRWNRER